MSHVTKPPVWLYIRQKWGMYNSNTQDNNSQLLRDKGKGEAPSLSQARDAALCHNRSELHFDKQRLQSASDLQRGASETHHCARTLHCSKAKKYSSADQGKENFFTFIFLRTLLSNLSTRSQSIGCNSARLLQPHACDVQRKA